MTSRRRHRVCRKVYKVRAIAQQEQPAVAQRRVDIDAEVFRVGLYVVGAGVDEHRHALRRDAERHRQTVVQSCFSRSRSTRKQVRPTVAHAGEPVVEQGDAAANDAANGLSLPSRGVGG